MKGRPTFEDIFDVMSKASVGLHDARVPVPAEPDLDHVPTRFSIALNLLLDDLAERAAESERSARLAASAAAKDAFLATVSHEIRTPLNGVLGMTSILLSTELAADQREMVETVRRSGQHLLTLINDILDLSKIEADRFELELLPFDLRQCVEETIDLVTPAAVEKGLELLCSVDEDVPRRLVGDIGRLRQVLLNLVGNAVKFTERGEVVVWVKGTPLPDGRHEIRFSVQDTGPGILAEDLPSLFQAYSQVRTGARVARGGTGLGLSISKRLCEMMGGRIWVESAVGKGSTFHAAIPHPVDTIAGPRDRPPQTALPRRVLVVVDDHALSLNVLALHLSQWGLVPHSFATLAGARRRVETGEPFDAIVASHPGSRAPAFTKELEAIRALAPKPTILLVPRGARHRDLGLERIPGATVLVRPLRMSHLYDALLTIFAPEVAQAPLAQAQATRGEDLARRKPLRILVVEDNSVNQKVALAMLRRLGYGADVAGDGVEAVEALARQRYDLVLMDLQMPRMDGVEATRHILAKAAPHERPHIVAMTAAVMPHERARCLEAGMVGYLSKPVSIEKLVELIEGLVPPAGAVPPLRELAVDPTILGALRQDLGGQQALDEVLAIYLKQSAKLIGEMIEGAARADATLVRNAAHGLKSASAIVGATYLSTLCRRIEHGDPGVGPQDAEAEFARVKQALVRAQGDVTS